MAKKKQLTTEEFNALPKNEQKVLIAKDVIAQVLAKKYVAKQNQYIEVKMKGKTYQSPSSYQVENLDIQKALPEIEKCRVCAIGSCILSIAKFKNSLIFREVSNTQMVQTETSKARNKIGTVFNKSELAKMEAIFENGKSYMYYLSDNEKQTCAKIYSKYKSQEKRLLGIMEHIVEHGTIKLDKFN